MRFTSNKNKKYVLLLLAMFLFSCINCFPFKPVEAQTATGYLTIYANAVECASVYVYDSTAGTFDTFTSFPASFAIYETPAGANYIELTVTAQAGYAFAYASSPSSSYLSNPFSDYFTYGADITINFTNTSPPPTPTPPPGATPTPTPTPSGYNYIFHGVYDENNQNNFLGNATVTAYYPNGSVGIGGKSVELFTVNGTYTYVPPSKPLYFKYDLSFFYSLNTTRQYWLGHNENNATLNIYATQTDLTTIAFSIFNYKNIEAFAGGALLSAKSIASLNTIDRRLSDSLGTVSLQLQPNTLYELVVESVSSGETYDLGPINTATSVITLNIPAAAFPADIVALYTYSYAWAYRDFSIGSVMIRYEDTTGETSGLQLIIADANNGTVYVYTGFSNLTQNVNAFNYAWNFAVNSTDYRVFLIVTSVTAGTYYFKQVLTGINSQASSPFNLSFLGSISGINTAMFIPAFIIILVAGVFSQITAEVAAFLTSITAIILVVIGWISISNSMLIVALSLSLLAGIVSAKRRFG